jgi:hypothetical protein
LSSLLLLVLAVVVAVLVLALVLVQVLVQVLVPTAMVVMRKRALAWSSLSRAHSASTPFCRSSA